MTEQVNELVFLLDKSGSMEPYIAETIDAVNQAIKQQRNKEIKTSVTIALFSTDYIVLYDNVDINEVKPLTTDDFHAQGGTKLLDSIGTVINGITTRYDGIPYSECPIKTNIIVTIITDGEENSSRLFDIVDTRYVVRQAKEHYCCKFVLIGIDINSYAIAEQLEIPVEHTFEVKRTDPNWAKNCFVMMCQSFDDLL